MDFTHLSFNGVRGGPKASWDWGTCPQGGKEYKEKEVQWGEGGAKAFCLWAVSPRREGGERGGGSKEQKEHQQKEHSHGGEENKLRIESSQPTTSY